MPDLQDKNSGTRFIGISARAVEGEQRRVELSFSSEQPYLRWFGSEILCHDEGCIDLSRVGEVATVLFHHGRDNKLGCLPIAKIEKAWIEDNRGKAIVIFDDDEDSEKIYKKVLGGSLKGVSVGYNVTSWESVSPGEVSSNGRFTGPCEVALKWELIEISIEPTPADPSVGIGRAITTEIPVVTDNNIIMEGKTMPNLENLQPQQPQTPPAPQANTDEIQRLAIAQERSRVTEISELCRSFEQPYEEFIQNGNTIEEVRTAILTTLAKAKPAITAPFNVAVKEVGEENFRRDISDGLALRAGVSVATASNEAKSFVGMRLRDIAVECLARNGEANTQRLNDNDLFKRALAPTSAFSSILDNTVSKSMQQAQSIYDPTFRKWAGKGSVSDFKNAKHYKISEAGELLPVRENGEFVYDEMRDSGVSKSVLTYGRAFGFTREAMINDDLDVLSKIPQAYVISALRGINKMVYKMLGSNPVIYDGNKLFSAEHKNIAALSPTINTALFAEMKRLMRNQKDISEKSVLNLQPSVVIAPSSLEVEISQFLMSLADVNGANSNVINVFRNAMDIVIDAELDQYSEDDFYMSCNSAICNSIEVTYLNGVETPTLESNVPFDRLGIEWRIFQDVGVNCLDYRGLTQGSRE